jgi:phosphate:Na+ symporter
LERARPSVDIVRRRLAGEAAAYAPPGKAVRRLEQFVETHALETLDLGTFEQRLVRICHALDHLNRLHVDLIRRPHVAARLPPPSFPASVQALAAWLDATRDAGPCVEPTVVAAIEDAAHMVAKDCRSNRNKLLEDVALQRISTETTRNTIEALDGPIAPSTTPGVWRSRCAPPPAVK